MKTSYYRGHKIVYLRKVWRYQDTGGSVSNEIARSCGHCGRPQTEVGHDGCIEELPGLMNACCGHGELNEMYVQYHDGVIVSGIKAKAIIDKLIRQKNKAENAVENPATNAGCNGQAV